MTQFSLLFSPIRVGAMDVRNRVVMSPMITNSGDEEGHVTDQTVAYYTARARGEVGWIIIESSYVHRAGIMYARQLGLDDDKYIEGLRRLATSIKKQGARVSIQLYHGGRRAQRDLSGCSPEAPASIPLYEGAEPPRALTREDIEDRIKAYMQGARRAREAGFDGVDIHAGHGYLICSFLAKFTNQRTDEFGGDLPGRARFLTEVIGRIRKQFGEELVISARINGSDFVKGGLTHEESKKVAQLVEESGANAIQVTGGHGGLLIRDIGELVRMKEKLGSSSLREAGLKLHDQIEFDLSQPVTFMRALPMGVPRACFAHLARGIRNSVTIPVLVVGRINRPEAAEEVLNRGDADMTVIGRALLADPEWPRKARRGDLRDIRPCIGCNYGCFRNLFHRRAVRCAINPFTGKESWLDIRPAPVRKSVVVVGAGPGGLEAAATAATRGHRVKLYEKDGKVGGQLNVAFIPPDREEIRELVPYYVQQLDRTGVQIVYGKKVTWEDIVRENPDVVILATGGVPTWLDGKDDQSPKVIQAIDLLAGYATAQGKVLVVGGGSVGCQTVDFLAKKGIAVTLVEMTEAIAADMEPDDRNFIAQKMIEYDVDIHLGARAERLVPGKGLLVSKESGQELIEADTVVLALGFLPNRDLIGSLDIKENTVSINGKNAEIYLIGDCKEPRKILEAVHEGAEVGLRI